MEEEGVAGRAPQADDNDDEEIPMKMPEAQEQLLQQGAYAVRMSPEQSEARIRQEIAQWAKVIHEAKIKAD